MKDQHDPVDKPRHYNVHPSGVEAITIIEHYPPNIANALKYLWRYHEKGKPEEDLQKAQWYINRELVRIKKFGHAHCLPDWSQVREQSKENE